MTDIYVGSDNDGGEVESCKLSQMTGTPDRLAFRNKIGCILIIISLIMFVISMGLLLYSISLPSESSCESTPPGVHLTLSPIAYVTYGFDVECYDVGVKTNATLWDSFPIPLNEADNGMGPAEETLSFMDSNGDGRLTIGDALVLECLQPDTDYELVLVWASDGSDITSETFRLP